MKSYKAASLEYKHARQGGVDVRPPSNSKKNTKRWCKGKAGVEHTGECKAYDDVKHSGLKCPEWKILVCKTCGKELDNYWPYPADWNLKPIAKPEWVKP